MSHILVLVVCVLPPFNLAMSEHKVVLVGDSIVLIGTERTTSWHFHHLSYTGHNDKDRDLYMGGEELLPGLDGEGFRITVNKTVWEVNLIIANVTVDKAGEYKCWKDRKNFSDYKLIVLEKVPVCRMTPVSGDRTAQCAGRKRQVDCNGSCSSPQGGETLRRAADNEFIGPNTCDIPQDQILVSCDVTYYGNNAPFLELRNLRDNKIIEMSCNTTELNATTYRNRQTCNATLNATMDLDGTQLIWETNQSTEAQYNGTTEPIKILYSFNGEASQRTTVSKGDKVVCTSNSSVACTYKWVWYEEVDDDLSRTIESTSNTLVAKKIGLHRCEAQCKLRNQTCRIFPQYIEVIESGGNLTNNKDPLALIHQLLEKENNQWTPPLIVLLFLGVLQYFTFGCYLLTRMQRKRTLSRNRFPASEYQSSGSVDCQLTTGQFGARQFGADNS